MFNKHSSHFAVDTKALLSRALSMALLILGCFAVLGGQAHAVTVDWSYTNPDIVNEADSVSQTVDGITVTAQGFVAEIHGSDSATIFGPFPTSLGAGNLQVFGTHTAVPGAHPNFGNPGLGLLVQPVDGITLPQEDFGGGNYAPGIDNSAFQGTPIVPSFEYVLFSFSKPVSVNDINVDDVSNFGRAIWIASGTNAPGASDDFLSAFHGFSFSNHFDDATDGPFTHHVSGVTDISYLAVGALPRVTFDPLASPYGGVDGFFITGLDFQPGVAPPPASVPEPSTWALMVLGFLGLAAARAKRAWRLAWGRRRFWFIAA
jgi:hypothetical protein